MPRNDVRSKYRQISPVKEVSHIFVFCIEEFLPADRIGLNVL